MLIKNALIVTIDNDRRVIKNGDILIEGNRIMKIGKLLMRKRKVLTLDEEETMEKVELSKEDLLSRK